MTFFLPCILSEFQAHWKVLTTVLVGPPLYYSSLEILHRHFQRVYS